VDRRGRFYFPSLDGLVWFHPDSVRRELSGTTVLIDDLRVDSVLWDPAHPVVSSDFNRISGDVSTPYFGHEDNLQLEYLIEPMGQKWYPIGRDGKIVINRLPYGHYVLRVRARRGPEEHSDTAIDFEVLPHWYNTRLFLIIVAAGFVFLAWLVYKLRMRWLLRQNMRLQQKVEERTRELEESSYLKESLISVIMHDLRSPLFSMSLLIDHLIMQHRQIGPAEMDDLLGQVGMPTKTYAGSAMISSPGTIRTGKGSMCVRSHWICRPLSRRLRDFTRILPGGRGWHLARRCLPG
jgi:signal transduction histidine kinase